MDRLSSHRATKDVVEKHGFKFSKSLGQNFLIDDNVIDRILAGARLSEGDKIIEVGPGIGTLTREMGKVADKVVAIEIDKTLIPILRETLGEFDNIEVVNQDILKVDVETLVKEKLDGGPVKLVANLPYYITTPIVMKFLEEDIPVTDIVVMVQKEVADRMNAVPSTKDYGALSLAVQYYARPQIIANVPPNCFMPRPKVGSAVIQLVRYEEPPVQVDNEKLMFRLIRASFNQRRKTLVNGLKNSQELDFSKEEIEKAMAETGIPVNVRGEALTLAEFADLANAFNKLR